jgi:hypothetical protein
MQVETFGVGRTTISPNCDVHTEHSIHLPMHSINTNVNLDLIAENQNNNVLLYLMKTFESIIPKNLSNVKTIKDFSDLVNKAFNINIGMRTGAANAAFPTPDNLSWI